MHCGDITAEALGVRDSIQSAEVLTGRAELGRYSTSPDGHCAATV
jgi:hypothetical protein